MPTRREDAPPDDREALRSESARLKRDAAKLAAALHAAEQQYGALLAATEQGVWTLDAAHVVTTANAAAAHMLGRDPSEMARRAFTEFVSPEGRPGVQEGLARVRETPVEPIDCSLLHRNGSPVPVRLRATALREASGQSGAVLLVSTDLSADRLAERALQESRQRLAGMVESAMDAIIAVDTDQHIVLFNPAAEQMFHCPASDALGSSLDRFIPPHPRVAHRTHIQEFGATGVTARHMGTLGALTAVRSDGEEFAIEASISKAIVAGKDFYTVILRDISERLSVEKALRENEVRYRLLFDNSPMPTWVYDRQTLAFLAVNEAAVGSYGYSREDLACMSVLDLYPPEERAAVRSSERASAGAPHATTRRLRRKDGSRLTVHLATHDLVWSGREARLVQATDITQRLRFEEELRTAYANLRALVDSSPLAIVVTDEQRTVRNWNAAAERMFGWSAEEVLGQSYPLVPDDKIAEHEATWDEMRAGRGTPGIETKRLARDGSPRDVILYTAPMRDPATGAMLGLSILADNGERLKLQQQLLHAQKMEGIGRLAGGVAHDFNNLLTAILGYVEMARDMVDPATPVASHLSSVELAAIRAADLTRQLLAFAHRQIIEPRIIDLNEIIIETEKLLRRLIGEDIELVTLPRPDLGLAKADAGQIEQVIVNLAVNARDAMPDGGRLTIETENVALGEDYARTHADVTPGPYVLLAVSDTGVGMTDEVKAHAFEPFFTTKEIGKGTGLGLATCFGIVKQSGGHIWYYSEVGRGTTIKVYLPRAHEEARELVLAETAAAPPGGETILLAEDEPMVREMIADALKELGYTVLVAHSGAKAVEIAAAWAGKIDLLITDVVMPGYSGKQTVEELARANVEPRVLYMSGYTHDSIVHHGVLDEAINFLAKPFTPAALAHKVRAVLDTPRR